jgi:large subunit ribosomal protein L1
MELKEDLQKALAELRKTEERKFNQTVDLIINLQKFDIKKDQINLFVSVPHKIKDKKIAAFLEVKNNNIDSILKSDFGRYANKNELKKLVNKYDFFISQASLMPVVATTFGRALGPAGKMPSPQVGIMMNPTDREINELKNKINSSIKIRTKEASIKIPIGKQNMKDEEIIDNILSVYAAVLKALPKGNDNLKNIEVKFTMTKPQKIRIK